MRKKTVLQWAWYCIAFCVSLHLCSCVGPSVPQTQAYKTPAVYFAPPQLAPVADSNKIHAGVTHGAGMSLNVWGYYRFKNNMVAGASYNRNGAASHPDGRTYDHAGDFDYRNRSRVSELFGGYIYNMSRYASLYAMAGYGDGSSASIVPEYDGTVKFPYTGNYSKWFGSAGITFYTSAKRKKAASFSLSYRGSWIKFSEYVSNAERYSNVKDFLSDAALNVVIPIEFFTLRICIDNHLNGYAAGDRLNDRLFGQWRRFKTNIAIGAGFRLWKE